MADIKYDYKYFHKTLLKLKSLNFERYQHITEYDLLIQALNGEEITDHSKIDWRWLKEDLYGDWYNDKYGTVHFEINGELEDFINRIMPREERVRILTFLRDNCRERLFDEYFYEECVRAFETECARLISKNIEESKNDQYHGAFALWPKPELKQIAIAQPSPKSYTTTETIVLKAIPNYSDNNIISRDILLRVAYKFIELFQESVRSFEKSERDPKQKPVMSYKQHADNIYNLIIIYANRRLYYDRSPVYQVFFILGCLMGLPDHRRSWHEEKFAEGIGDYLEMTDNFKGSKEKIKNVIQSILTLSQYQLDFDMENVEAAMSEQTEQLKQQQEQAEAQRLPKPEEIEIPNIAQQAVEKVLAPIRQAFNGQLKKPEEEPTTNEVSSPDDSFFAVTEKMTHDMCKKELLRCIRESRTKAAACRAILTSAHAYFVLSDKTNQEIAEAINPWVSLAGKDYVFTEDDFRKAKKAKNAKISVSFR